MQHPERRVRICFSEAKEEWCSCCFVGKKIGKTTVVFHTHRSGAVKCSECIIVRVLFKEIISVHVIELVELHAYQKIAKRKKQNFIQEWFWEWERRLDNISSSKEVSQWWSFNNGATAMIPGWEIPQGKYVHCWIPGGKDLFRFFSFRLLLCICCIQLSRFTST